MIIKKRPLFHHFNGNVIINQRILGYIHTKFCELGPWSMCFHYLWLIETFIHGSVWTGLQTLASLILNTWRDPWGRYISHGEGMLDGITKIMEKLDAAWCAHCRPCPFRTNRAGYHPEWCQFPRICYQFQPNQSHEYQRFNTYCIKQIQEVVLQGSTYR